MIIFALPPYDRLASEIASKVGAERGEIESRVFPDGERYMRVVSEIRDRDVAVVAGTVDDTTTLDLFDLSCCLVGEGCRSLKLVVPFYGYATMERAVKPREVVKAKTRARILSAIPLAPFGNQVGLLDLHAEGIPFYFEGAVKTRHLYAKPLIIREAKRLGGDDFVLSAVDAGRAKWVESLARDMHVTAGFVYKRRDDGGQTTVSGANIPVSGRPVIVYDDMIRSGGSILQACEAYLKAGASRIDVITTHGVFAGDAVAKLKTSGLLRSLVCTDSHPRAIELKDPFVSVVSTAEVFAQFLKGKSHAD